MTTDVSAIMRRSYTAEMFADLTSATHVRVLDRTTGITTLTFAGTLDAATVAAIWARAESRDDADQATRATLRADRDDLDPEDPLRRLYDYTLGD